MTIILSNAGDQDSQILRDSWINVSGTFIEITAKSDDSWEDMVNQAIQEETDTLVLLGHGTSRGLLFPKLERDEYIIHENNVHDIKAKNIICIWCYASAFIMQFPDIHNVIASSMFISNVNEAYDYGFTEYNQNDINQTGKRCDQEIIRLLTDHIPMNDWVMRIGAHADILNDIDVFNRQGFYYQR